MRSMKRATPESTPRIKFDHDEVNKLLRPKRVPSVSTPKRVGDGTTIHQEALHPQVGKQLHGGNLHHGMSDFFLTDSKVLRLQAMAVPLERRGGYTQHTKPARNVTFPAHLIFFRVVFFVSRVSTCQRLSHAQHVHVVQDESRLEICTWSVVSSKMHTGHKGSTLPLSFGESLKPFVMGVGKMA